MRLICVCSLCCRYKSIGSDLGPEICKSENIINSEVLLTILYVLLQDPMTKSHSKSGSKSLKDLGSLGTSPPQLEVHA
jgi:hypothetical protein